MTEPRVRPAILALLRRRENARCLLVRLTSRSMVPGIHNDRCRGCSTRPNRALAISAARSK